MSPQNPTLVAAAQVECPGGVRLVLQDLAAHEAERLLERGASAACRFPTRALQQLVEAVEVERDELGREAVRLRLRDDELACPFPIRREVAAKHGDERLERAGDVLRPSSPQTSSARRSVGTRWPRAASRISMTCFGRTPPRSRGPRLRVPSSIERARTAGSPAAPAAQRLVLRSISRRCVIARGLGHRTVAPVGRTTSQRPPNSSTFWQRTCNGSRSPT